MRAASPCAVARTQSGCKPGWRVDEVAAIAEKIADELADEVLPFVRPLIKSHHDAGRTVVLATASNLATVEALADRLEFDHVVATKWTIDGDAYTGAIDGVRLHAGEKKAAVLAWAEANDIDLAESYAYSDSRSDADLLAKFGHPVAVNPDAALLAARHAASLAGSVPRQARRRHQDRRPRDAGLGAPARQPPPRPDGHDPNRGHREHPEDRRRHPRVQPPLVLRLDRRQPT